MTNVITLGAFIPSLIQRKVKYAHDITISSVEVCFFEMECWKYHKKSDVYFVNRCSFQTEYLFHVKIPMQNSRSLIMRL